MQTTKHRGRVRRSVVPPELAVPIVQGETVVPDEYRPDALDYLCEQIMLGKSMREACQDDLMPSQLQIVRWLNSDAAFKQRYTECQRVRVLVESGNLLDIADGKDGYSTQRDRIRLDTRFKMLAKLEPSTWGDRVEHALNVTGELSAMLAGAKNQGHRLPDASS